MNIGSDGISSFAGSGLHAEDWELALTGVVVRVPSSGQTLDPGAFSLAGNSSFDEQGLSCTVTGLKKKTKETSGKLDCDWTGEGYRTPVQLKALSLQLDPGKTASEN